MTSCARRTRSFEALAAADHWQPSLIGAGDPEQLDGQRVTAGYFGVFGEVPIAGRTFTAAEDQPGGPNVVILSQALLDRRFGGDRSIIGRTIQLDGDPYTVIGVMPHGFANVIAPSAELWSAMRERSTGDLSSRAWGHHYQMIGRLAPSSTIAGAMREIVEIGSSPAVGYPRPPWADLKYGMLVRSIQNDITGPARPALFAIIGAVLLLLAIAAVNVTNLQLARAAQRRAELSMRVALGAGRVRLVRQLITESVTLAACGRRARIVRGGGGCPRIHRLESAGSAAPRRHSPGRTRVRFCNRADDVDRRGRRSRSCRGCIARRLRGRTAARRWARHATYAHAQCARRGGSRVGDHAAGERGLAVPQCETAGRRRPGFDPSHVVTMQVVEAGPGFHGDSARLQFFQQALDAVRRVPGVDDAAFTSQLPLSGESDGYGYEWQSLPSTSAGQNGSALRYAVTPDYLRTMRIPLRRGRFIDASDRPGAPEAIVINESLAHRLFGGRNPIGERVRFGPEIVNDSGGTRPWDYVVGVVGDVKQFTLAADAPDAFYVANGQWWWTDNVQSLVVRATGNASALVPPIEHAIWSVSANVPIRRLKTMNAFIEASAGQRRFALIAIEAFAVVALVLAAVGLYGVISGSVTERIREIGIRSALGAAPADIVRSVVGNGVALTLAGAVIGIAGAYAASHLLASMLFGISRVDAVTYLAVIGLLLVVALLGAWAPARRAAGVDPTIALRAE